MGSIGIVGPFSLWLAWLLLFLTSLSLPIIKSIYLMKASFTLADGSKGDIRFGVWGECVYGVAPTAMGFTGVNFDGQCTHKGLGLTTRTVDTTQVADVMFAGASWSLVLHPVACAAVISGLFLLLALWLISLTGLPNSMHRFGARRLRSGTREFFGLFFSLFPLGMIITATILTTVVFILDMIIVGSGIARAHENHQAKTSVSFGGVPWMTFVAMILTWVGCVEAWRASFSYEARKFVHRPTDY